MNAFVAGLSALSPFGFSRAEMVCLTEDFDRPTLVVDVDTVAARYRDLSEGLGRTAIHYAVKANPHPVILARLVALGCGFDAASRGEIEACLAAGAAPTRISFGNTIKRERDIAWAFGQGVTLFAADALEEVEKIACAAPGARVYIRVRMGATGADWPLSRKFGCAPSLAPSLVAEAAAAGLLPVGLSFHIGSQTRDPLLWGPVLDQIAALWAEIEAAGFPLSLLNIGGGFPASYQQSVMAPLDYARSVMAQVDARFGSHVAIMAEPGRGLVADCAAIAAEVMLVARKSEDDLHRWVYLDIGRFSGLAETEGECIRYRMLTHRDHEQTGPCVLAGPSCDSADTLYEKLPVHLPLGLKSGDRVVLCNAGAYTSSYSSVGFNGFPPLAVRLI